MYNESQKEEFIRYAQNDYWKYVFEAAADYEAEKREDLARMDTEELLAYLLTFKSFSSAKTTRSRITKYIDWCVIKGYAPFNWIAPAVISNDFLQEVFYRSKTEFYISREMYEEYVETLKKSTYGVYITSFFVGIYEGLDYAELAGLRLQDIDRKNRTVKIGGRKQKVSSQFIQLLLAAHKVTEVESRSRTFRYRYALYPDSIWKSRKEKVSSSSMVRQFRCLLDEAKEILDEERLTKTIIRNSGYFNKIYYELLEDGIDVKELKFDRNKEGFEDNRKYDKYFRDSVLDKMDMRQFIRSFQSYLEQVS